MTPTSRQETEHYKINQKIISSVWYHPFHSLLFLLCTTETSVRKSQWLRTVGQRLTDECVKWWRMKMSGHIQLSLTCELVLSLQEYSGDHRIHEDDTADKLPLRDIPSSFLTQTPFPCSALCLKCPSFRTSHGCLSYYSAQMPLSWRDSQPVCIQCCCCCSVAQSCPTLCDHTDCSTPVFPVLHYLQSLLKPMSMESVMSSNHLILCCPLLLLPSIFLNIRGFSNELALHRYICIFSSAVVSQNLFHQPVPLSHFTFSFSSWHLLLPEVDILIYLLIIFLLHRSVSPQRAEIFFFFKNMLSGT